MDKVIVADAELRTSLSVIRSLSLYGLKVISISRGKSGGYLTKYTWKKLDLLGTTDEEYTDFIITTAKLEKAKAIFAHFEKTLLSLHSKMSEHDNHFKIIMPPIEIFQNACKKEYVLSVAKEIGLPVPETIYCSLNDNRDLNEIYKIIVRKIPCFIKTTSEIDTLPGPMNRYLAIKTKKDLENLPKFIEKHKNFFIQQYIDGYGCGIAGVFFEGDPVAVGGHIRLRESFATGGVSTYCESKIHKEAMRYALMLMKELKWTGIAMIEFKVGRDGIPFFMELNPRIWGTIPLYIASGINIPVIAYELFINGRLNFDYRFREGIKMRFLVEDFHAIITQYGGIRRIKELIKVFLEIPKVKEGIFDIRDPMPFLMQIAYMITKKIRRMKR